MMEHEELTRGIIGGAVAVHRVLGPGFLESVYQRALIHELRTGGVPVEDEKPILVLYVGVDVGVFSADLLVAGVVLVEIKAIRVIVPAHEVQLVNYLTATGVELGLLLNFGAERLGIKRKYRTFNPKELGGATRIG
jgi:GxxExxY protein